MKSQQFLSFIGNRKMKNKERFSMQKILTLCIVVTATAIVIIIVQNLFWSQLFGTFDFFQSYSGS